MKYTPNGKGHRILARAEQGAASKLDLLIAAGGAATGKRRERMWHVIRAALDDRLLARDAAGFYLLTPAGADALACLRAGYPAVVGATGAMHAQLEAA